MASSIFSITVSTALIMFSPDDIAVVVVLAVVEDLNGL